MQKKRYEDGSHHYCLPGGALDLGETLAEGLKRECAEEIGCKIKIHDLMHAADYFKVRDIDPPNRRHQVELIFSCSVPKNYEPQNGPHPDKRQVDVLWMKLSDLDQKPFSPQSFRKVLKEQSSDTQLYLGVLE